MGNEQSIVRNLDKRTARREYGGHFNGAISKFRWEYAAGLEPLGMGRNNPPGDSDPQRGRDVRVCVRKRPFFQHEKEQGEYDVITTGGREVVIHDARMHSDMRHMFINHHSFGFDAVFGEEAQNDEVYEGCVGQVVQGIAQGMAGTVLMYGQTGSGKTYTMSAIHERAARELFDCLAKEDGRDDMSISMSCVELAGDQCRDILHEGRPVQLLTGKNGDVQPYPVVELPISSAEELLTFVRLAASLRATEATGVHDQSSRSHSICRIFVRRGGEGGSEGMLQLVDLAGTEHRVDSAEHGSARRKECAQINSSLASLKECVRLKAAGDKFVPFRKSKLTHMLKAAFTERSATVVIATVSPAAKDTEQSLNTLRHACIMDGQGDGQNAGGASYISGGNTVKQDIGEIDVTGMARERIRKKKAGIDDDGTGKWAPPPKVEDPLPPKVAARKVERARQAAERKALKELDPATLDQLMQARAEVGSNRHQMIRLQRYDSSAVAVDVGGLWRGGKGDEFDEEGEEDEEDEEEVELVPGEGPRGVGVGRHQGSGGGGGGGGGGTRQKWGGGGPPPPGVQHSPPKAHHTCGWGEEDQPIVRGGSQMMMEKQQQQQYHQQGAYDDEEENRPCQPAPKLTRHEEVARRRAEKEEQKKEELRRKLAEKERRQSTGILAMARQAVAAASPPSGRASEAAQGPEGARLEHTIGTDEEQALHAEIAEANEELAAGGLSESKAFGLRRRVATCRGALLRIERERERERREVQRRAEEAMRNGPRSGQGAGGRGGERGGWGDEENEGEGGEEEEGGGGAGLDVSTYVSQPGRGSGPLEGPRLTKQPQHGRRALPRSGPPHAAAQNPAQSRASHGNGAKADGRSDRGDVAFGNGGAPGRWGGDQRFGNDGDDGAVSRSYEGPRSTSPGRGSGGGAGRGGGGYGKGLSDDVVSMMMEDADAMYEVLVARELRRCVDAWKKETDIAAMSLRGR